MITLLDVEPVSREYSSGAWLFSYSMSFLGRQGCEQLVKTLALHLSEVTRPTDCLVWRHETGEGASRTLDLYLTFSKPDDPTEILDRITDDLHSGVSSTKSALPAEAVPVLRLNCDGEVVRLWPEKPANMPRTQQLTVDWGTFTVHNRVYRISN